MERWKGRRKPTQDPATNTRELDAPMSPWSCSCPPPAEVLHCCWSDEVGPPWGTSGQRSAILFTSNSLFLSRFAQSKKVLFSSAPCGSSGTKYAVALSPPIHTRPARIDSGGFQAPFPPAVAHRLRLIALTAAIE